MSAPPAPHSQSPTAECGAPEPFPAGRSLAVDADPVPPADLVPEPRWWKRLAWYSGAMVLGLALAACGMQLWDRDFRAPFYYDLDGLLYLPLVKTMVENGSQWRTERLGAPGQQELYDFPIIDQLHLSILWLIGRLTPDLLIVYNSYSLLTYPLTVLTSMWVLRWVKLTLPTAALGGVLYAFLPYHQERYQFHYFLAAYWWVPVSLVPAFAICKGDLPFFATNLDGTRRWHLISVRAGWTLLIGAVTASAGAYYGFFACAIYAFSGAYSWIVFRTWRAAAAAILAIAPVVAVGFLLHLPTFIYHHHLMGFGANNGVNPLTRRYPEEADSYGLKIAHLLLPATDHNFRPFANVTTTFYSAANRPAETERSGSLGIIGGIGLLSLFALAVLPSRRHWPYGPLVALTLFLILLTTIGAFGSLFNLLVNPQIRAYNRASVFIAFLCFLAVLWWLDRFLLTRPRVPVRYLVWAAIAIGCLGLAMPIVSEVNSAVVAVSALLLIAGAAAFALARVPVSRGVVPRRVRAAYGAFLPIKYYPVLGFLLILGYFDQTPWGLNPFNFDGRPAIDRFAERYRTDRQFFKRIEEVMPPGAKVFCLPYIGYPESPALNKMAAYEHARGYLMTDSLHWSYGAIKGREADVWQKDVNDLMGHPGGPERLLERIVAGGFDGLFIDGRGFPATRDADRAAALIKRFNDHFQAALGSARARLPEIVHPDGRQFFLDLRPFRAVWQEKKPVEFAARERFEREWIAPLWLDGFCVSDPLEPGGERLFWGPFDATLVFVNPTDRTRTVDISFTIGVDVVGPFDLSLSGLVTDSFTLDKITEKDDPQDLKRHGRGKEYLGLELPPGRSAIHFRCRPPSYFLPFDRRNLCYFIRNFKLEERNR